MKQAGVLTIDLAALCANYRLIQDRLAAGARAGAAVKANAYGLGAVPVVTALYGAGCRDFFVAHAEEGAEIRACAPDANIYVLDGFYEGCTELYIAHSLTPCLGSFAEIADYQALARSQEKPLPAMLNFNIRMNRLGLNKIETKELLDNHATMLAGIDVKGIMNHFSCADTPDHPITETQFKVFSDIARNFDAVFPALIKSLCNSSGLFRSPDYHFDLVRPGMALYGLNPTPEQDNPMHPVVRLEAPIIRTRIVYQGASIGYDATYKFKNDTLIATVAAGYADGLPWSLSNQGAFYWKGYRCLIRGRVSMDMSSIDLSAVPENDRPQVGDFIEVIGDHQNPAMIAKDAGALDYEILTSLGKRYDRRYLSA